MYLLEVLLKVDLKKKTEQARVGQAIEGSVKKLELLSFFLKFKLRLARVLSSELATLIPNFAPCLRLFF